MKNIIDVSTLRSVTFEADSVYKLLKDAAKFLKEQGIVGGEYGSYYGESVSYEYDGATNEMRLTLTFNMDAGQYVLPDDAEDDSD